MHTLIPKPPCLDSDGHHRVLPDGIIPRNRISILSSSLLFDDLEHSVSRRRHLGYEMYVQVRGAERQFEEHCPVRLREGTQNLSHPSR